jgi:hypothetical protein
MKPAQSKRTDEMRMSAKEFDRIMGQALRVKPQETKAAKLTAKIKATRKKAKR